MTDAVWLARLERLEERNATLERDVWDLKARVATVEQWQRETEESCRALPDALRRALNA